MQVFNGLLNSHHAANGALRPLKLTAASVTLGSNQPFAALLRNGYFGAKAKLCKRRSLRKAVIGPKRSIPHFGFKHAFRPSPKHIP